MASIEDPSCASRSCPVRLPVWDAVWSTIPVARVHIASRKARLHCPGFIAPQEIVIQLCSADSSRLLKSPSLNTKMVGGEGFEPSSSRFANRLLVMS
jgi:hypothetical protein